MSQCGLQICAKHAGDRSTATNPADGTDAEGVAKYVGQILDVAEFSYAVSDSRREFGIITLAQREKNTPAWCASFTTVFASPGSVGDSHGIEQREQRW